MFCLCLLCVFNISVIICKSNSNLWHYCRGFTNRRRHQSGSGSHQGDRGSLRSSAILWGPPRLPINHAIRLLLAMPPTQVSVKRLFSALKLSKFDRRGHLKEDILINLLLLKCNRKPGMADTWYYLLVAVAGSQT